MNDAPDNPSGDAPACLPPGFDREGFYALSRVFSAPAFAQTYRAVNRRALRLGLTVVRRYGLFHGDPPEETSESIEGRIGLAPQARYFIERVLTMLEEEQFLTKTDQGWAATERLKEFPSTDEPEEVAPELADDPVFEFFARCERHLHEFLTGKMTGPGVVFFKGDWSFWVALNNRSILFSPYAELAAFVLSGLLKPDSRVLEVGAGTGAATAQLLARMPPGLHPSYFFTDLTKVFLQTGRRRFGEHSFIHYQTLNLDSPPQEQGFELGTFDFIFGVNALHVARDIPVTLEHLRTLLKPGGRLVVGEGSPPDSRRMWRPDLLFGLLEGWWKVETDPALRPRPGWLMPRDWQALLASAGFANVCALPGEDYFGGDCYGGVVIGQAPAKNTAPD